MQKTRNIKMKVPFSKKRIDEPTPPLPTTITNRQIDSYENKFNKISLDKSSCSSLSWGDDIEYESTQLVQLEFERMERVLQGTESIPPHYNQEEYNQWINTFPFLRTCGKEIKVDLDPNRIPSDYEEIIETHPLENRNIFNRLKEVDEKLKQAVIDRTFQNVCEYLFKEIPPKGNHKPPENLKVAKKQGDEHGSTDLMVQSERSALNWLRDCSPQFSSLPCLSQEPQQVDALKKVPKTKVENKPAKDHSSPVPSYFMLPPINSCLSINKCRSISASQAPKVSSVRGNRKSRIPTSLNKNS